MDRNAGGWVRSQRDVNRFRDENDDISKKDRAPPLSHADEEGISLQTLTFSIKPFKMIYFDWH